MVDVIAYGKTMARRAMEIGKKPHVNAPIDFDCFRRHRLTVPPDEFRRRLDTFRSLQENGPDQRTEYRSAFWFQFPTTFDGVANIKEYYHESPIRSVELMDLAGPHMDLANKEVLSLGFHNGAELFWLYDHGHGAKIHGIDSNPSFFAFARFLCESYGLTDRIELTQGDVIEHVLRPERSYDVIIAHGLLYMLWDPFLFLRAAHARLNEGGICSLEVYVLPDKRPIMEYLGDGSGWGDTFGYSHEFLAKVFPALGFKVEKTLDYRGRKLFILRKAPPTTDSPALHRLLAGPSKPAPRRKS